MTVRKWQLEPIVGEVLAKVSRNVLSATSQRANFMWSFPASFH